MGCIFSCCKEEPINDAKDPLVTSTEEPALTPDSFQIIKIIGRGNFGKVCLVKKIGTEELYAMKILKKKVIEEKKQRCHTITEKIVLESSKCPFIVKLFYAFQTPIKFCLILEVSK